MSSADEVLLKIRAEGWRAAAKVVRDTEKALRDAKKAADKKPTGGAGGTWLGQLGHTLRGLPASWRAGQAGATQFRRTMTGLGADVSSVVGTVGKLTAGAVALTGVGGTAGVLSQVFGGIGDNAAFQDTRTSFKTILGDLSSANSLIEEIRDNVSSGTRLRLTELFAPARQLLGFGLNDKQALRVLETTRDATLATSGGPDEFQRITRALGQIRGKGRLLQEEMNQLTEVGVPVEEIIRDAFSLSNDDMANIGNLNIPWDAALHAITEGWSAKYSQAAEEAVDNFNTERMDIAKQWEQLRRLATEPLFGWLDERALPELKGALGNAVKVFDERDDLTFDAKAKLAWDGLREDLGPLWSEIEDGVASLDLDEKLRDAAVAGLDLAVKGVVAGAPKVASAFWDAFTDMSAMGKFVTTAFLWNRLRLPFLPVAGKAAGLLWKVGKSPFGLAGRKLGATAGAQAAKSAAETAAIRSMILGDAIKAKAGPGMGVAGGALGAMLGAALAAKTLDEITKRITGDSLSERLREGVTGRDKDGRRTMPGTGGFGASPGVRQGDRSRLADLEAMAKGTYSVPGPGGAPLTRGGLTDSEKRELESLRKRLRPRATGGTVRPGEFTIVGERGPELARFPSGTEITSNRQARAQDAGSRSRGREVIYRTPIVSVLHASGRELARVVNEHDEIVELRR